ncbi:competence/damage-inducible protein A [Prochlorothrix hollandica]|uniref:competence/damage-inducible protein A n=1 Tax=Prochlorothrix hollandica TaxID=1223 RepID=UPI003340584C
MNPLPDSPPQGAEIICVGTELLLGEILNSNAQFLAQQLAQWGVPHYYQTVVGDNPLRLQRAIATACQRSQLLIFTGGLGPTPDDLTTETLADFFGVPWQEDPQALARLQALYQERGRVLSEADRKQARLPLGSTILPNPIGSAVGMIWTPRPGLTLMTFPGVPTEMRAMWHQTAVPYLQHNGWSSQVLVSRTLRFWGISESVLADRVRPYLDQACPTVASYADWGEVQLRITAPGQDRAAALALIEPTERALRQLGGSHCYGCDGDRLAAVVGQRLLQRGETVAVAESCTGGGLGQALTATAGSSAYFWGGVIAYDNRVKAQVLGVSVETLATVGAVSREVAEQMAVGVCRTLGTTWGLSVTGIAGPGGGTADKPVGLVYLGLAQAEGPVTIVECRWNPRQGRDWIRQVTIQEALDRLRHALA